MADCAADLQLRSMHDLPQQMPWLWAEAAAGLGDGGAGGGGSGGGGAAEQKGGLGSGALGVPVFVEA